MNAGFMIYDREDGPVIEEKERLKNFDEFHLSLPIEKQKVQASRCMNCGVPFCQFGQNISGMTSGCPLNNLVPEINDLVSRGNLKEAYRRLSITHSFPEFTSRVCPALCEAACTCSQHGESVTTKENEKAVIEYAFENGLVDEEEPRVRTGKKVAVIGSGPSGLSCAQLLNRRGHKVTVYERSDKAGGLLRYGIPNMKLDKRIIDRRIDIMKNSGIDFVMGVNVGEDIKVSELREEYDSIVLACGASNPRDINVPGRDSKGIYFAVDFLSKVTKTLQESGFKTKPFELAKDKDVIVIGGGDTGNDCVGTCIRLGAKSVTQLEMMPKMPDARSASNPWPEWPKVLKTDYGQEEAIYKYGEDPRIYQTTVKEFITKECVDEFGNTENVLKGAVIVSLKPQRDEKSGRMIMTEIEGSEKKIPADLVLICAGFLGSESYVTDAFSVKVNERTNVDTPHGSFKTSVPHIYAVGDMHTGQSLVVKAIAEGRKAAKEIDKDLMGYSNL